MEVFKCKMCGNKLEIDNNTTVATCEHCGTQQNLSKLDDEKSADLYDSSNHSSKFDVFICCKETDDNGRRTPDSALADDLYHQLTQAGFKVFITRIMREDKKDSEHEPYILEALNSAKVMVVLGTKAEFFHDVRVKNEWSRYLELMKQGQKKLLIPVCMGIPPHDLPEEFFCFQPLDMFQQEFMQDLIRRITRAEDFQIVHVEELDVNTRLEGIYNKAKKRMDIAATESSYKEAAELFESIREFKDSAALMDICYEKAEKQAKKDKRKKIISVVCVCTIIIAVIVIVKHVMIDRTKEIFRNSKEGDTVLFGEYVRNDKPFDGKEAIEWIVLEKKEGRVLVISKEPVDSMQYHTSEEAVTWEMCTLRKWLNDDFARYAFSGIEKSIIDTVAVSADRNPEYDTNPGNATQDKVFLLSIKDVNKYLDTAEKRQCADWWWLRTPGAVSDTASYVHSSGSISEHGLGIDNDDGGVRPALWIDLNS